MTSRRRPGDPSGVRRLYLVSVALAVVLAAMIALAAWAEVDDETYYRFLGAVAVANVLVVVLQPIVRRMRPRTTAADISFRLVFTLDRAPSGEAVQSAAKALEEGGARVQRVEPPR